MNRIDRLMGMINLIQSRKHVQATQIAERFEISVRTVFRDLRALDEIGVPIGFEPNKGYFIAPGYFLPPVCLSPDEANALVLIETIVKRFADRSILKHYGTALNKIKGVMGGQQKAQVERLQDQIQSYAPMPMPGPKPTDTEFLSDIQHSIVHKQVLRIAYTNVKDEASEREVEPIGLTFYSLNWHLIAWCWKRKEYRDFRVSRIQHLHNTGLPFRKEDHLPLMEYLQQLDQLIQAQTWE